MRALETGDTFRARRGERGATVTVWWPGACWQSPDETLWDKGHWSQTLWDKDLWSQTSALTMTLLLCGDMMFCSYGRIKYLPKSVSVSCYMFKASLKKYQYFDKGINQKYTVFLFKYCQLMPFIDIRLQWYKVIDYLGVAKSFCLIKNKWHTICPKPPRHGLSWF